MKRSWATWTLLAGLAAVFAGARVFDGVDFLRLALVFAGAASALGVAALRTWWWRAARGSGRAVEAVFALGALASAIALAAFLPGTDAGVDLLGLEFDGVRDEARFKRVFRVAAPILLACGLLPTLTAQWAAAKGGGDVGEVDAMRVRESAANALSVALGGAALVLLGYVASALNRTADFSYFKTSAPGEAVREIVRNMDGTLRAALFFPEVDPVKDEVLNYLRELQRAADNLVIEEYDRYADPQAAADYNVRNDGELFLRLDGRTEEIGFPLGLEAARGRLMVMDSHVQQALLLLTRERRVVYLTTGHGELNDPLAGDEPEGETDPTARWRPPADRDDDRPLAALREMLTFLNYEVLDIGIQRGLGDRIPDDAAMVMTLGPQRAFLEAEVGAIGGYLDRGGSLLVALEPDSDFRLSDFRDRLGVAFDRAMTIDENRHLRMSGTLADRRLIVTNRFSTHPSVTTASRRGVTQGIAMIGPGGVRALEDVEGRRARVVVNALRTSFLDWNGNLRFDEDGESRDGHGLAVAVEGVSTAAADSAATGNEPGDGTRASERPGMRALVYGDAEIFSSALLTSTQLQAALVADGIRWLGREEAFSGSVSSEEDVPITHTRAEDVAWFYGIIFGAPTLVLTLGLGVLYGRQRKVAGATGR